MLLDPTQASAAMDCAELRRSFDAYLDRELAPPEEAEAARHLAQCPACRGAAEEEARLRALLRAQLHEAVEAAPGASRAPEALRGRIEAALDGERRPFPRRLFSPFSLAAIAACAAALAVVAFTGDGDDPLAEEAVRRHSRDLPLEVSATSLGADTVARWFTGKLDFNPSPPQFPGVGARMVGARLTYLHDRPAAYVRYDVPRGHLGHLGLFILDDPSPHFWQVGHSLRAEPLQVRVVSARGFNVAIWRRNAIVYSLVSDLGEADLVKLVQASQAPSMLEQTSGRSSHEDPPHRE